MPDIQEIWESLPVAKRAQELAVHEAGHAIVAEALRLGCHSIWIAVERCDGKTIIPYNCHNFKGAIVAIAGYVAAQVTKHVQPVPMWEAEEWRRQSDWDAFENGVWEEAKASCEGRMGEQGYEECKQAIREKARDAAARILADNHTLIHKVAVAIGRIARDKDGVQELGGRCLHDALDPLPAKWET